MSNTNKRTWERNPTAKQTVLFDLSRLRREGAIIPVIPWWGTLECGFTDRYVEDQIYIESLHQDLEVNHFHDGEGINLPYGLS